MGVEKTGDTIHLVLAKCLASAVQQSINAIYWEVLTVAVDLLHSELL
jgi:hypothetical protein